MSSAEAQIVYNSGRRFSVPDAAQENFAQQYDLANPEKAMSSYQRYLVPASKTSPLSGSGTICADARLFFHYKAHTPTHQATVRERGCFSTATLLPKPQWGYDDVNA